MLCANETTLARKHTSNVKQLHETAEMFTSSLQREGQAETVV